ncbi:serine/threonine-protein kinase [Lyngbya confervoides]|uniref:non-specific serine/threonine protein kinase n=1 Tax=Lyngbya confervoides BDU141951 TaxID=1574623 RepID=A0ABD4T4E4_9CYAN|nr:serine/threonine-protein kinase [Lyngbya confervoides]MCM1983544.1 serine/threonine protein kinase [Lyngbya confervoides BDU141951]
MAHPSHSVPELLAHRYRVIRVLGEGGFGTTYLAADTQMPSQRTCVVKQLKPMTENPQVAALVRDRFQREAAILEMLGDKHEQIPRLYANFAEEDHYYLVEEWIEGETLSNRVETSGPQDEAFVRHLLLQVLPILDYIHQHQMVHRDLKPDNILLRRETQQPVLIDFGAVKESLRTQDPGSQGHYSQSIVVGTPGFMPAEQLAGYPVFASDIYSLGMTAIYALTGKMPALLPPDPVQGTPQWRPAVPHLSPDLADILDRSIQMTADRRFPSARDMLLALQPETVVQHPKVPVPSPPLPETLRDPIPAPPPRTARARLWILGGATAAVVAIGAIALSTLDITLVTQQSTPIPSPPNPPTAPPPADSPSPQPTESPSPAAASPPASPVVPSPAVPSPVVPSPVVPSPPTSPGSESTVVIQRNRSRNWAYMGTAVTGEQVFVDNASIVPTGSQTQFTYRIGSEQLEAQAACASNQWFVKDYGWYSPQSEATQSMLDYVCRF